MSPTYEYGCDRCGEEFQATRPMSESAKPWKCPNCKVDCKRIIGRAPAFILKGKGWPGKAIKNKGN